MSAAQRSNDLYALSLDHREATYLDYERLMDRRERVLRACDADGLARLKKKLDEFIAGERELSAIEFYLELERASVLLLFHTLPRRGDRNKNENGLQQTYGDHIRLLLHGFDMFDAGNVDWASGRCWQSPLDVKREELEDSIARYHNLDLTRSERVSMWIVSALHDYGKIFRRGYGLDAEDAAPLCRDLVATLAPPGMEAYIQYGIRNHDLIEHTVTGDTPACLITEPIEELPPTIRPRALQMLALIQLIGAASLGEGRITRAKLAIYNACLSSTIVAAGDIYTRLGRLLFGGKAVPDATASKRACEQLESLCIADRELLSKMLTRTSIPGWAGLRKQIMNQHSAGDHAEPVTRLLNTLVLVSRLWRDTKPEPMHVVIARPKELAKCTALNGDMEVRLHNEDQTTRLLNGATALILR